MPINKVGNRVVWDMTAGRAEKVVASMEGRGLAPVEVAKLKAAAAEIRAEEKK
jgi:hypothetical protein